MIERKIVIGLITSTPYLQMVKPIWNVQYLESDMARRVAGWCWEYFDKYKKAPGGDIEALFFSKVREGKISKDLAEEIEEDILANLSEEYSKEGVDLKPLFDETEKYFNERSLSLLSENVQALVATGKTTEAISFINSYRPVTAGTNDINKFIHSVAQIRRNKKEVPLLLMRPWLRAGQLTIIYGNYGSGKSLLTILIGYMLGLDEEALDGDDCEIGKWQVKNTTGCLYIDGELGEVEMEERIAQYEWLGVQKQDCKLRVLSIPEYQLATEDSFYLVDRVNQLKIIEWLKLHPNYKLVVLDSASTLFGLVDENSNSEWNVKISPFLRDLRALGVACILLHHSGKDGKRGLRGASAMGAMAHNIYRLANHDNKKPDDGEAWFVLTKDKQRAAGRSFKTFSMQFIQTDDKKETHWVITEHNGND